MTHVGEASTDTYRAGCRCVECKDAWKMYWRQYRAERKVEKGEIRIPRWDYRPVLMIAGESVRALAERLGVHERTLHRPLTDRMADRAAVALGKHPVEVWPDWFEVVLKAERDARAKAAA